MRTEKTFLIIIMLLTISVSGMIACAEITGYEAVDSINGVTYYYLTAGHEPDAFGNVWYGGPDCVLKSYELSGDLPDSLYLIDDARGISLAGRADQVGKYAFSLTLRYADGPDKEEKTAVIEYICYILDRPAEEALVFSDGHFQLIPRENTVFISEATADTNAEDGFFASVLRFLVRLFSSGNNAE